MAIGSIVVATVRGAAPAAAATSRQPGAAMIHGLRRARTGREGGTSPPGRAPQDSRTRRAARVAESRTSSGVA